ncbi:hypothetical protein CYMTET_9476 [Cymbomonas tetramitiformis]|uniref:Signal recognition particle SRP54 subunit M-domain domain-containing protein n=1 Tax=Cymbomonas tetramitiformis TaxID=36881 RepID=A0AAE0LFF1_9CHLO|nr:hypothetical protein CYMTET_9476 [Cymbomonas tetramitiformis]
MFRYLVQRHASSAGRQWVRTMSTAGGQAGGGWMDSVKGMFGGSSGGGQLGDDIDIEKGFTIDEYATQLKRARQLGSMTDYLPQAMKDKVGTGTTGEAMKMYQRAEDIVSSMTPEEKTNPNLIPPSARARIATQVGCNPHEIDDTISKYEWMKRAVDKMAEMKKDGKPLPQDMKGLEAAAGGPWRPPPRKPTGNPLDGRKISAGMQVVTQNSALPGRNAPCPCGSGKRHKRCCWKD